jgi:hypothetical protein
MWKRGRPVKLAQVETAYRELLPLRDRGAARVALAGVVSGLVNRDAAWPLLVGDSSFAKNELIASFSDVPGVWRAWSLTNDSLLASYTPHPNLPAPLLQRIGSSGVLVVNKLTDSPELRPYIANEVLRQLRAVAHGRISRTQNGEKLSWKGSAGMLAGVSAVIDDYYPDLALMNERFLLYRMLAQPAQDWYPNEKLRQQLRKLVGRFVSQVIAAEPQGLNERCTEPLIHLAGAVTRARASAVRRRTDGLPMHKPEPSARLAEQLIGFGGALLTLGISEPATLRLLEKIAWDSAPPLRRFILEQLRRERLLDDDELARRAGQEVGTIRQALRELTFLDLVDSGWIKTGKVRATPTLHDYWKGPSLRPVKGPPKVYRPATNSASLPANAPKSGGGR